MPLPNLLRSAVGTCRYCSNRDGLIARDHHECRRAFDAGWNRMVELAADAARTHNFDEKGLRISLAEMAKNSYGDGNTVNQALEEGWKRGVGHAMADGIITQAEEAKLREFRDRLTLADSGADEQATALLDKASRDRLTFDARLAAVAVEDPESHLADLTESLRDSVLPQSQQTEILIRAWEAAVESALEDGLLTLDEENSLGRYMDHFNLTQDRMNQNGVLTQVVKAAVIRDITEGIVPDRQNIAGRVAFNLMKSEKLVWVMTDVDYRRSQPAGNAGEAPTDSVSGSPEASTIGRYLPEQGCRVGGDRPPRHRTVGIHHQAHLLLGSEEEVQSQVRPGRGLRTLRRWVRADAGRPDGEAAELPDRGRVVRVQPRHQPSTDVEDSNGNFPNNS